MCNKSYSKNKILGGIWGLIIGDAVGVPYEYYEASQIPKLEEIDLDPPSWFKKSYTDVPIGTYSDDSAQFLCVLDSYIECRGFDVDNLAYKIFKWLNNGLWAVDKIVFDVGNQTLAALKIYGNGVSPLESGLIIPEGKGNGSLMRVLGIPLLHRGTDEELVEFSHKQSLITHGNVCCQVCCALYSLIAKNLLLEKGFEEAYSNAVSTLKKIYESKNEHLNELENNILPDNILLESGTGYVVDCLKSSIKVIRESNSYEDVVKKAVAMGYDTDTTAAVAGGLAGIIYGYDNIKKEWYERLRGKEKIFKLIDKIEF
ncbi:MULTISPECIES: ADP-ribosylglycohydrolase family protein [unclassified Clostridium]|uniref:ADP-ribosylglycohydrolase family protein n=1 Tax=unclassified Clostridium TaxID=2614128 RepID=UPI0002985C3A|nr:MULTISPECIES: ADP-ribosylglycohydrolase family protein [unclassified Clostridium]EKQ56796.1 MAG: ADP-ribosylglycohydrolase [Clostridium sp. Maddingley MBC34-26]